MHGRCSALALMADHTDAPSRASVAAARLCKAIVPPGPSWAARLVSPRRHPHPVAFALGPIPGMLPLLSEWTRRSRRCRRTCGLLPAQSRAS